MRTSILWSSLLISAAAALSPATGYALQTVHREINRTKEKEVVVVVDVSFGSLSIERGEKDKIVVVDYEEEGKESKKLQVGYEISGDVGHLKVRLKKSSSHIWGDDESDDSRYERRLVLKLTNAVPLSLDLELGAGKGEIDLSGLRVQDLKMSTGASSVNLRCDDPNPISSNRIVIESGVSKFTATNLCNTNFRSLKFSGGVGSYKLDFGGGLRQDADVKIEVGLGAVTVNVPQHVAARLLYDEGWFSSFDLDREFSKQKSGVYETEGYDSSEKRLTIRIESGLGSVRVRRR